MVVDIIAGLAFLFVMYKMARESSSKERVGGIIGTGIGVIYCASQLAVWPTGCTEPFTGTVRPCGSLDGHPRVIITLAIIMITTWLGRRITHLLQSRSK